MADDFGYSHDTSVPPELVVGNKKYWGDTIWMTGRDDVPFLEAVNRDTKYNSVEALWFQEKLNTRDASNSQAKAQGSDYSASTNPRYECYNYNMIMSDSAFVSGSQEKTDKAGVDSELSRQLFNKMVVLKQSVEAAVLTRVKKRKPKADSGAGLMAGIPGLVGLYGDQTMHVNDTTAQYGTDNTTNVQIGEDSFEASTGNGLTEFKETLQKIWSIGGRPNHCWCGPDNKEHISETWDVSNVERQTVEVRELDNLVEVILTDFGTVRFTPMMTFSTYPDSGSYAYDGEGDDTMITDFAILANPKDLELLVYRDFFTSNLPTTKDGYLRRALVEFSLKAKPPSAIGVFDFAGCASHSITKGLPTTAAAYTLAH